MPTTADGSTEHQMFADRLVPLSAQRPNVNIYPMGVVAADTLSIKLSIVSKIDTKC